MKRLITAVSLLGLLASTLSAATPIGRIVSIEGEATIIGINDTSRRVRLKSPVFLNDKIITKVGAKLQIMFADESFLSQGESSEMTIDEYVYTPNKKKKVNSSMSFVKGIFRIVTGKITDLNPDRFRVRTKMATIGIRGCELGFRCEPKKEDIYIIRLPAGRSIRIEKKLVADEAAAEVLNIVQAGVAVTVQHGVGLKRRPIARHELINLIWESTPIDGSDSSGTDTSGDQANDEAGQELQTDQNMLTEITKNKYDTENYDRLDVNDLPPLPSGGPTTAPSTAPPTTSPPVMVGGNPTADNWEWGIWNDGTVFYSGNRYLGDTFLTANDFQNILSSGVQYALTGSGMAGAVLQHPAGNQNVSGPVSLNVNINVPGPNNLTWDGVFSLAGSGPGAGNHSLNFDAAGTIMTDGSLMGNQTAYSMQVNGQIFNAGTLTRDEVTGKLIRSASGTPPIKSAAGEFHFEHGTAASAHGAFGANLSGPNLP